MRRDKGKPPAGGLGRSPEHKRANPPPLRHVVWQKISRGTPWGSTERRLRREDGARSQNYRRVDNKETPAQCHCV